VVGTATQEKPLEGELHVRVGRPMSVRGRWRAFGGALESIARRG